MNEGNIRTLTRELLDYLAVSDTEFKPDLTAKICALIQRFAPDKRWHIDSLLQVMTQAGAYVKDEVRALGLALGFSAAWGKKTRAGRFWGRDCTWALSPKPWCPLSCRCAARSSCSSPTRQSSTATPCAPSTATSTRTRCALCVLRSQRPTRPAAAAAVTRPSPHDGRLFCSHLRTKRPPPVGAARRAPAAEP